MSAIKSMGFVNVRPKTSTLQALQIHDAEAVELRTVVHPPTEKSWYTFLYENIEFKTQDTSRPKTGDWLVETKAGEFEYMSAFRFALLYEEAS